MKMGFAIFKTQKKNEALRLCKERKRLIKLAIDSRYALAASHVSYIQSLRNVGIALRRFAEAEVLLEPSPLFSDRTPSQSTYPSLSSPSHVADDVSDSPLHSESHVSYMMSCGTEAVTVRIKPFSDNYLDDEFPMPPLPLEDGASWDFFDPSCEGSESFRFESHAGYSRGCKHEGVSLDEKVVTRGNDYRGLSANCYDQSFVSRVVQSCKLVDRGVSKMGLPSNVGDLKENVTDKGGVGGFCSKNEGNLAVENLSTEREDPSEFITHRAKDFLSSIKDIEHRFVRAFESGREVSRLLEANKIMVGYSEAKGNCHYFFCSY